MFQEQLLHQQLKLLIFLAYNHLMLFYNFFIIISSNFIYVNKKYKSATSRCNAYLFYYLFFKSISINDEHGLYKNTIDTKLHPARVISKIISETKYVKGLTCIMKYIGIIYNQLYISAYTIPSIARIIIEFAFLKIVHKVSGIINQPTNITGVYIKLKLPINKLSSRT